MRQSANTGEHEEETHLFLLRVWAHDHGDGQKRWQGKVQNVLHGDAKNFNEWSVLIDCLQSMLPALELEQPQVMEGE